MAKHPPGPAMTLRNMRELGMRRLPMRAPALAAFLIFCMSGVARATDDTPQVAFLGFQLINTSLEATTPAEDQRIRMLNELYQQKLDTSGRFKIVPIPPERAWKSRPAQRLATAMAASAIGLEGPGRIGPLGAPCRK
jgi:Protein of unknown function (DUF2380)